MSFPVNNIREVCAENGITLAELERSLKIGNGVIARWEDAPRTPQIGVIIQIAEYLNTSVGRLLGEKEKTATPEGDGEMQEAIRLFEAATPEVRFAILQMLRAAVHPAKGQDVGSADK